MMKVFSIFSSINGEVCPAGIGSPCTFIRFAGCSAGCHYCDSTYANQPSSGKDMGVGAILHELSKHPSKNITITGGEPFEQEQSLKTLLPVLYENGYNVTVETNGQHDFNAMEFCSGNWVVDIKSHVPISRKRYVNMHLRTTDFIKIVISNYKHFLDMLVVKRRLQMEGCKARFAFSPEYGVIDAKILLFWIMESKEGDLYLNTQVHKVLNLSEPD